MLVVALLCGSQTAEAANDLAGASDLATSAHAIAIEGERVTLGDLSPTMPRELLALDIAPAPAPGHHTIISRAAVAEALRRAGAEPELATGLPARQDVVRSGQNLSVSTLEEAVRAATAEHLPLGISIGGVLGLGPVTVPLGEFRVDVNLGRLRRSTTATVSVWVGERRWSMQTAKITLQGTPRTPVLRSDVPIGTTLDSSHIELQETDLERLPVGVVTRSDQIVGQRLRTAGRAHAPIRATATEPPPVIVRGHAVMVVASTRGLRITRQAVAQQDGHIGDMIRVRTVGDETILLARVTGEGEVRVELGGRS